jgi:hypothetical protein
MRPLSSGSKNKISFMLLSCLGYFATLTMERYAPPKRELILNELHGIISYKIESRNGLFFHTRIEGKPYGVLMRNNAIHVRNTRFEYYHSS